MKLTNDNKLNNTKFLLKKMKQNFDCLGYAYESVMERKKIVDLLFGNASIDFIL